MTVSASESSPARSSDNREHQEPGHLTQERKERKAEGETDLHGWDTQSLHARATQEKGTSHPGGQRRQRGPKGKRAACGSLLMAGLLGRPPHP